MLAIISTTLTFAGSFIAAFMWAGLFTMLDASSPKDPSSTPYAVAPALGVASVYWLVDLLLPRPGRKAPYLQLVKRVVCVSFIGTNTILVGLFAVGLIFGYVELRQISVEVTGAIILGSLLFLPNVVAVLGLKTVGYLLGLERSNGAKTVSIGNTN